MNALSASSNAKGTPTPIEAAFAAAYDRSAPAEERAIGEAVKTLVGLGHQTVVLDSERRAF